MSTSMSSATRSSPRARSGGAGGSAHDPATKYIVEQVSKIKDVDTCVTGYYKNQTEIIRRLEKTDQELNRLRGLIEGLDTRDVSRYFKEGMDSALSDIYAEIGKAALEEMEPSILDAKRSLASMDSTSDRLERSMMKMVSSASQANNSFSEAIQKYRRCVLRCYQEIRKEYTEYLCCRA